MAWGQECLLLVPGVCINDELSTVACHSNLLEHGKGKSLKAHDFMSVWGCRTCHAWLDGLGASYEDKRAAFEAGHERQLQRWREIAAERTRRPRNIESARRAVETWERWSRGARDV